MAGPDLLPAHDIVVTVSDGPGAQTGEITAGARFGESLTPHMVAGEDAAQMMGLLLGRAFGDEGRAGMHLAHETHTDIGGLGRGCLLEEDQMLCGSRTAPAVLGRPVHTRVSGLEQHALPHRVVLASARPVAGIGRGGECGDGARQPRAQLGAEFGVGFGITEMHGVSCRSWSDASDGRAHETRCSHSDQCGSRSERAGWRPIFIGDSGASHMRKRSNPFAAQIRSRQERRRASEYTAFS